MVHQSSSYFEHCHSADYDASVSSDQRTECWSAWLQYYTLGQSPERLQYARARIEAIEAGEEVSPLPGVPTSQLGSSFTASYLSMGEEFPDADPGTAPRNQERLPSAPNPDHECSNVCVPHWNTCIRRCDEPYGGCRDACEIEHRTCLNGCF
jgi:hypothetical protein